MAIRWIAVLVMSLSLPGFAAKVARADAFDQFTNRDIAKAIDGPGLTEIKELTVSDLVERGGLVPGTTGALLFVQTDQGRYAKLIVQPARQKIGDATVPMLLIERFICFQEGTERAVYSSGRDVRIYPGFRFSIDIGQVVPEKLVGDMLVSDAPGKVLARPLGKARFFLASKLPAATMDSKPSRFVMGEQFETRYFNGSFKLFDDGRRAGKLILAVDDAGNVSGNFYSEKDSQKYDVTGKVGPARHAISFTIKYPRVEQTFQGFMFTGDGKAIAGTNRMQERESGFYALRIED